MKKPNPLKYFNDEFDKKKARVGMSISQEDKPKKKVEPDYSNIKGTGWNYFKDPTAKDSADYKKGFDKAVNNEILKQFPSPSSYEIKGYNEAKKRKLKTGGSVKTKRK